MEIPPELFARLAHPTVRLSGSIDEATAASFLSQVLPVLEVPSSIVVELFSSGGAVEVGRRVAQEVRILRQAHGRDMWFLGKTLVASAAVTIMAGFPRDLIVVPQLVMPSNHSSTSRLSCSNKSSAPGESSALSFFPSI